MDYVGLISGGSVCKYRLLPPGFALLFMKESFRLDYVWAALCMVGAVYFIFRGA